MTGPKFTARADDDLVRMIVITDESFQSWALTQSEARDLRDALTLSLAPAAMRGLHCRITKGRKACRSCGAASGQAHAEGCAEILQPAEDERRVGPPERRAAACFDPRVSATLDRYFADPPTPEEKAAGEWAGEYRVAADPPRFDTSTLRAATPVHVACDECFRFPPRHSWDCSKRRD